MAGRRRRRRGKLLGLLVLLEEHQEAIEADLLEAGYRLRWLDDPEAMAAHDFDWRDLLVLVKAIRPTSALYRAQHGDDAQWGLGEQLLAHAADSLAFLVWAKTEDGQRGRNRPKRIPRPGVTPDEDTTTLGGGESVLPAEDMWAWLDGPFVELNPDTGQPLEGPPAPAPAELDKPARDAAIRDRVAAGIPRREVAAEFGISVTTVGRAIRAGR